MIELVVSFLAGIALATVLTFLYAKCTHRESVKIEERARNAERLAYVGTLAGGLAHEIKNPLSTININLQLLKEDLENGTENTLKEKRALSKINTIQKEANRLQEVLNDFLRFTRKPELELSQHDVNDVIDELLDFVRPEMSQNNIHIRKSYDDTCLKCDMDSNLIKQSLLNIIINAQQAMPDGGELMIRTCRNKDNARITITDTGTGIPREELDKIFNVYYSTKKTGTGLGLPTAKRIIEDHRGTIEVESEEGKGTQFTIQLPFKHS